MTSQPGIQQTLQNAAEATLGGQEFAARFRRSSRTLWLIAAGTVGRTHAEDVVQEAALIALKKLDQFEPGTNFTAWMGQMVRHVAMNSARKEHRRKAASLNADDSAEVEDPSSRSPGSKLPLGPRGEMPEEQNAFDDQLVRALREVNETARACLLLRTIEGRSYAEISEVLEIPEGTAMSHVHRTRKLLRSKLDSRNHPSAGTS